MVFDKNQKEFPSAEHNAIWNLGIHVMPIEITLPPEVKDSLPLYLVQSCEQLRNFLLHLLRDMYDNIELYLPLPHQLSRKILRPLIDFALLGEAEEECLKINRFVFDKFTKKLKNSKDYDDDRKAGVSFEYRLNILERVGLKIEYIGDSVIFTNSLYPNMFYAMHEMAMVTSNEKSSMDNSFTYCDFRKLCKSYKYDKYENALIFLNDEQKNLARQLDIIAKKLKLTRSIKSGHCAGFEIRYNYKKANLLNLNCLCSHNENNIILQINLLYDENNPAPMHDFFSAIESDSDELKKFVYSRIRRCRVCYHKCPTYGGCPLQIYGKPNKVCFSGNCALKLKLLIIGSPIITFVPDDIPFIEKTLIYAKGLTDEIL